MLKNQSTTMKTISNKTPKPISVPLPRGKKLHLGPGKTGQIASNASEHPPLKKLIDAGQIEIVAAGPAPAAPAEPRRPQTQRSPSKTSNREKRAARTAAPPLPFAPTRYEPSSSS